MPETFSAPDSLDPSAEAAERAGVQAEAVQARLDLDAELSPEQRRTAEITQFILENFPHCEDPAAAASECFAEEALYADFDPEFDITADLPFITEVVARFTSAEVDLAAFERGTETGMIASELVEHRNQVAMEVEALAVSVSPDASPVVIPAVAISDMETTLDQAVLNAPDLVNLRVGARADLFQERRRAQESYETTETALAVSTSANAEAHATEDELVEKLTNSAEVEARYSELKADDLSQRQILEQLLTEFDDLEIQARLNQILANISALENALPGKQDVVARLIESSNLDLGAPNAVAVFQDFFASAEASEELTADEVETLRQVLGGEAEARNASELRDALAEGQGTETLPDGTTRVIPYTADDPLELAEGVEAYPDPEDPDSMIISAQFSDSFMGDRTFRFSVPASMSGAEATEQINFFYINAIKESAGITGGTQQGMFVTQGDAPIDLATTGLMTQAARFGRITMDNLVGGFDTQSRFLTSPQVEQIRWGFQWFMPRREVSGDAAFGDNSEAARAEFLGGQGRDGLIFDAQGNLKEDQYRRATQFINGQRALGSAEPNYEVLRRFLESGTTDVMA